MIKLTPSPAYRPLSWFSRDCHSLSWTISRKPTIIAKAEEDALYLLST